MAKLHSAKVQGSGGSSGGGGAGATTLPDLTDVSDTIDTDAPNGGIMIWDDAAGTWKTTSFLQAANFLTGVFTGFVFNGDTTIYRYDAGVLGTDGSVRIPQNLSLLGNLSMGNGAAPSTITIQEDIAGSFILRGLVTADTWWRYKVNANGKTEWGGGVLDVDTNLYRVQADVLQTDDTFVAGGGYISLDSGIAYFRGYNVGDANIRFTIAKSTGALSWGDGTLVADTNLYRGAADALYTDDSFLAAAGVHARNDGDRYFAGYNNGDAQYRFHVAKDTGEISWGIGSAVRDTNLYRLSADVLKTDDAFVVGTDQYVGFKTSAGQTLTIVGDASNNLNINTPGGGRLNLNESVQIDGNLSMTSGGVPGRFWSVSNATAEIFTITNLSAGGAITVVTKAGGTQGVTDIAQWQDNGGGVLARIKSTGQLNLATAPTNSPAAIAVASAKGSGLDVAWADHTHAHEAAHINHDTTWATKGDLVVATANDTATVLPVGVDTQVLTADSTTGTGVKWAAGASGSTVTAFTKDLGAAYRSGTFDITGLSGLTADKSYDVRQSGAAISSKGNARDESEMDTIIVTAYALNTTDLRALWYSANGAVVVGTYAFVSVT